MNKVIVTQTIPPVAIAALALMIPTVTANANADDCTPHWINPINQPGPDGGTVFAITEYNGNLIAGGNFSTVGGQTVNRIVRWDGTEWHPFASGGEIGVNGPVSALTVYNGDLIVGGNFTTAGGQIVNRIARWDGENWHPFESNGDIGTSGPVLALTEYNGDLIAGGFFATAGGQTVNKIARWDGALGGWHSLQSGGQIGVNPGTSIVGALTVYDGDLIVGGAFASAGGHNVDSIARWEGASGEWHPLGSGVHFGQSHVVVALSEYQGDLFAGGIFTTVGGQLVNNVARWDGTSEGWHPLASGGEVGVGGGLVEVLMTYNDHLFAAGEFVTAGGQVVNHIAGWDGSKWSALGAGAGYHVRTLTLFDDGLGDGQALYVAGTFGSVGCLSAMRIARWGCTEDGPPIGDLNLDSIVNVCDLLKLLAHWGPCTGCPAQPCPADLDGDCTVNVFDLLALLVNWG